MWQGPRSDSDVSLEEWGSEYRLVRWVPDLTIDDIEVQVEGRYIFVQTNPADSERRYVWRAKLPEDVIEDAIHAEMQEDAVLTVILPKLNTPARKIPVTVAEPRGDAPVSAAQPQAEEPQDAQNTRAMDMDSEAHWAVDDLGGEYRLSRRVRGLTVEDVNVEILNKKITVSGGEGDAAIQITESLPSDVEEDFVLAELTDNVLTIVLPKSLPRAINIVEGDKAAAGSSSSSSSSVARKIDGLDIRGEEASVGTEASARAEPSSPVSPTEQEVQPQGAPGNGELADWIDVMDEAEEKVHPIDDAENK